jgi:hypothetical protein
MPSLFTCAPRHTISARWVLDVCVASAPSLPRRYSLVHSECRRGRRRRASRASARHRGSSPPLPRRGLDLCRSCVCPQRFWRQRRWRTRPRRWRQAAGVPALSSERRGGDAAGGGPAGRRHHQHRHSAAPSKCAPKMRAPHLTLCLVASCRSAVSGPAPAASPSSPVLRGQPFWRAHIQARLTHSARARAAAFWQFLTLSTPGGGGAASLKEALRERYGEAILEFANLSWEDALAAAARRGKPLFMYLHAADDEVRNRLSLLVCLRAAVDEAHVLASSPLPVAAGPGCC